MHPNRRRKKRPNYGIRTVEVVRGQNGFGFTISGQQPCILSCIVSNSPADLAGLRPGDFLISVNGVNVSKLTHDAVVKLIGTCIGPIRMQIAENYFSESSSSSEEEEYLPQSRSRPRLANRKAKPDDVLVGGPIEYRALVGYLGTIEMPKPPTNHLQTILSCIKRLRQEKRKPISVLMTVLPTCLSLKNSNNCILAIYPTNRIVYVGSEKESIYFGLVTMNEKVGDEEATSSCHVFCVDRMAAHAAHARKAQKFQIRCTMDLVAGNCLEFPQNALYIVSLVQNMYKLELKEKESDVVANSPQPSASSNSDSGIGYRDDCNSISDRILLVEFPRQPNVGKAGPARACLTVENNLSPKNSNLVNVRAYDDTLSNLRLNCRVKNDFKQDRSETQSSSDDNNGEELFKTPNTKKFLDHKKRHLKIVGSFDNLLNKNDILSYKLSPKVYGLSKPLNYSCEELNNFDFIDKYGYGSLQDLCTLTEETKKKNIAQSEPDVRFTRNEELGSCEQNGHNKSNTASDGPAGWANSFEKLLDDPMGLHIFAEFLKKEFSVENIYFWISCERYRHLPPGRERTTEAKRIYQQHLCVGAPESVNVDAEGRQCSEQQLQEPNTNIFHLAQKQIYNLMKFDSYPRFLKSDLYKECLSGHLEKPQHIDENLLLHLTSYGTPTKLKKSLSNAEDRRRKSLLPWHRKTARSKSKDRQESDRKEFSGGESKSDTDSDLAFRNRIHSQEDLCGARTALCRVNLSNGSTTVVQIKEAETVHQLVSRLLEKRAISYSSFEIFTNKHAKAIDVTESSTILAGCEVTVEQRVVFKLDLPNRKIISVKSKFTKVIVDVLRPILYKYQYNLDDVIVLNKDKPIDLYATVLTIDQARLNVQLREREKETQLTSTPVIKVNNVKVHKLEELTNQVFEGILKEKADTASRVLRSDKGSVKSEDFGSEHSSGIFGKFLRRDSGLHNPKKKAFLSAKGKNDEQHSTLDSQPGNKVKKPLIAKWKVGANKLQVSTCCESDDLVEGLTRAQRSRLEDQRGTEINTELPDFLKDKENDSLTKKNLYTISSAKNLKLEVQSNNHNYENRNILAVPPLGLSNKLYSSFSNEKSGAVSGESCNSSCEPPPLPPKPKIIPTRPSNWGQNEYFRSKSSTATTSESKNQNMFLEQPSSSFV